MLKSILIVEDDDVDQYIAKRALKQWGFEGALFQEYDGVGALEFLTDCQNNKTKFGDDFPPTLIMLDINMPRMNGFEFLEALQELNDKNDGKNSIVIVMFSSSERQEDKDRALQYDFVLDYLTKPPTEENIEKIMSILD